MCVSYRVDILKDSHRTCLLVDHKILCQLAFITVEARPY